MNDTDLEALEQALGVRLPADYRATMLAYPFPPDAGEAALGLLPTAHAVLAHQYEADEAQGPEGPWPAHYVVIGSDGGEESYVLDVSREPAPVLAYDLETGECRPLAPDVGSFVEFLRRQQNASTARGPGAAAARARRPWWRRRP